MRLALAVCTALCLAPAAVAQTTPVVLQTDLECRLSVDGKHQGIVNPKPELRLTLPLREHRLEAVPLAGDGAWQKTVEIQESNPTTVTIPLRAAVAQIEMERRGYWIDSKTRLMWAAADNGSAVSWGQAALHCRSSVLGGFHDWSLPAIDDLQSIFGGTSDDRGYRIVSPIKLTGWAWSSTPGKQQGEAWALDFGDGGRASVMAGDAGLNRALCVRHSDN